MEGVFHWTPKIYQNHPKRTMAKLKKEKSRNKIHPTDTLGHYASHDELKQHLQAYL